MPNIPLVVVIAILALYLLIKFVPGLQVRTLVTLAVLGVVGYFLVITVAEMPLFGAAGNPHFNEIPGRFLEQGLEDTGVINSVSAIITDYRAFDTLGEATVLFTAIAAVIAALKSH